MATFGRTDPTGFANPGNDSSGDILGNVFTLPEDGDLQSISGYFASGSSNMRFRGVVYNSTPSGGCLGVTAEYTQAGGQAAGFKAASFSSPLHLTAGDYFLGIWFGGTSIGTVADASLEYDSSVGTWHWHSAATYASTGPGVSWNDHGSGAGTWGVYATYTLPGSGASPDDPNYIAALLKGAAPDTAHQLANRVVGGHVF